MGHNKEPQHLLDALAWHEDNVEKLRALLKKYDKEEADLIERERLGLWYVHVGEVS